MMKVRVVSALLGALVASGCALTSKGDALVVRWYTPESPRPTLTSVAPRPVPTETPRVQLGRVSSGVNLREKIAYRDSTFEQGYYDDRRWSQRPEAYVRRALERTLFEEHGFRRALAAQAPVLDVEVVSFEEVLGPGAVHAARIQLKTVLHDEREVLLERTLTVERLVDPSARDFSGVVQAMAQALEALAEEVTSDVARVATAPQPRGRAPVTAR